MKGHTHNFDHVTYVVKGSAIAKCWRQVLHEDGSAMLSEAGEEMWVLMRERECGPGTSLLIKAEMAHELTALEAGTELHCIYAHRTAQGDVVQEHTGWTEAYE